MRVLVLTQGIPGSGKSTHIRQMGWEPYTISTDNLRLLHGGPVIDEHGDFHIDQKLSGKAWNMLFELVEGRMKNGEFTVVDATHCSKDTINKYRVLSDKYRYRVYILRFDVPVETAIYQDGMRPQYKQVGEAVIRRMHEQFKGVKTGWAETFNHDDMNFYETKLKYIPEDVSRYEKIVHFGDLQGCADPLKKYFDENPYSENNLYVFVGDLVDRGIQNAEVVQLMVDLCQRRNVVLVEGNHEHHLNCWGNDLPIVSDEFAQRTKPQLEEAGVDKKAVRELYRRTRQILYYQYDDKFVFVTHGGIPKIPNPRAIIEIATRQYIKGVGRYEIDIDQIFEESTPKNEYQVHGHRNAHMRALSADQRSFNLEGGVEFGGHFRVAELSKQGWKVLEIQNHTFDIHQERGHHPNLEPNEANLVTLLRGNKNINEKQMGNNISSFNFDKETFYEGLWNAQSVKARGLFINTSTNKIVARSYEKFFNVNEKEFTKLERLKADLAFPVKFYRKENGFLGILGYDEDNDQMIIASKSTTKGEFAGYFKALLETYVDMDDMKQWLRGKNCSIVFEVVNIDKDPHIIEYDKSQLVILNVIDNTIKFTKWSDELTVMVGERFSIPVKTHYSTVYTPDALDYSIAELLRDDKGECEGYVIEDAKGFMTKLKLPYYNFWKYMRGVKEKMYNRPGYTLISEDDLTNKFVSFLHTLPHEDLKLDIITLRKRFYERT